MATQITVPSGVSTYVSDAATYAGKVVFFSGVPLYDVTYCGDAALYYINSAGAWDAFLIGGKVLRTDKYTQGDYYKSFDNSTIEFGKTRWLNEIRPSWELHTGWLTDEQAERLVKNLLPSTQVYLHDLVDDEYFPVNITDTSADYKTYENQGKKLVAYTIKVEGSQGMERNS